MNPSVLYLIGIAAIALGVMLLERRAWRIFDYLPGIVIVYALSMAVAQSGIWSGNAIAHTYATLKSNLLPAMLFLMLLSVNFKAFFSMGKTLLIAYSGALVSLFLAFVLVFLLLGFNTEEAGIFAALGGSWMGGTANMLAVGSALHVSESAMGFALIVDSINYSLWVSFLLITSAFAPLFNRWSRATSHAQAFEGIGCSCTIGPKRYWLLLLLSLGVALFTQLMAPHLGGLGATTWVVLLATLLGLMGSKTPLSSLGGSSELANTMLYLLVALIGSRALIEGMGDIATYIFAGMAILLIHAALMVLLARLFKLDLFAIGVASLANIGGVASAPILAATYDRALIGVAVLMAVMGYLIGTFGGLTLGWLLQMIAA